MDRHADPDPCRAMRERSEAEMGSSKSVERVLTRAA
jgi:hypothetical protein